MIRSMTGFGRGEATAFLRRFTVELKAVNNRFCDVSVKMPRVLGFLEDELKSLVTEAVARGKVDVYVGFESMAEQDVGVRLNTAVADGYVRVLGELKERYNLEGDINLSMVSRFPDVISLDKSALSTQDDEVASQLRFGLLEAASQAVSGLINMREAEGTNLSNDLLDKCEALRLNASKIKCLVPEIEAEYKRKLTEKVQEALGDSQVDEARLLTEVTIFVDRTSVDEELTRLSSHLDQFKQIITSGGTVGRKLDFLTQELNREVNTIGSKAQNIEVGRLVVEMKTDVEKIREQVQNIE